MTDDEKRDWRIIEEFLDGLYFERESGAIPIVRLRRQEFAQAVVRDRTRAVNIFVGRLVGALPDMARRTIEEES